MRTGARDGRVCMNARGARVELLPPGAVYREVLASLVVSTRFTPALAVSAARSTSASVQFAVCGAVQKGCLQTGQDGTPRAGLAIDASSGYEAQRGRGQGRL